MLLAKLNTIEFWVTDVGNAHLDPSTTEKVKFPDKLEFGEREGHILMIGNVLYGLHPVVDVGKIDCRICMIEFGFTPAKPSPAYG
jgi:hypothetical protein